MVEGIEVPAEHFKKAGAGVCEPCVFAKQHKAARPSSTSVTDTPLQLVHMDVCGPMQVDSLRGAKYFCTFLDDYSKLCVVRPIVAKSDVVAAAKEVFQLWETQTGHKLLVVRSDGGGEYVNKAMDAYLRGKGVAHQTTTRYTPEQNGAAERLNRTLMERVRAMLEESGLPKELWGEAVRTAAYLKNRSPTSKRTKTPWELFYGKKPDVSRLRVFGATAYALIPTELRKKLDKHSDRGRLVGYGEGIKGYRILLDGSNTVVVRSDVVFTEDGMAGRLPGLVPPGQPGQAGQPAPLEVGFPGPLPTVVPRTLLPSSEPQPAVDLLSDDSDGEGTADAVRRHLFESPELEYDGAGAAAGAASDAPRIWNGPNPDRPRRVIDLSRRVLAGAAVADPDDPATFAEAMNGDDAALWRLAMDEEMESLRANNTWTLEECPRTSRAIPVKWVFKKKLDSNGSVERYKARLVVKGFHQREGIDFEEVFAPVSKYSTMRALLGVVASRDLALHQLDIKTAFLNGELEEEVYVEQPPGYVEDSRACHLHKALYGLRQAPRAWHMTLKAVLEKLGFRASDADGGLYVSKDPEHPSYLLIYVDDILIAAPTEADVEKIKEGLLATFEARDLGEATFFLGMDIRRDRQERTIKLSQERMTTALVERFRLQDCKPRSLPLGTGVRLCNDDGELLTDEKGSYATLVGSLLYISVCTRPDISQAVGVLSRFMQNPTVVHQQAALGVLKYLAGSVGIGITFGGGDCVLEGYCDADYAGDLDGRKSTTGFVFILDGGAISWSSKRQATVAASTTEAEYIAAALTVKEALWLRVLLGDLGVEVVCVQLFGDNQGALKLLKNPVISSRSKHIDVVYHFARERVALGQVKFEYIRTDFMLADMFTKPVPKSKFAFCCSGIGVF